jgi:hypothetical protein
LKTSYPNDNNKSSIWSLNKLYKLNTSTCQIPVCNDPCTFMLPQS